MSPMAHSRVWEQELSPGPVIPRPESAGLGEVDVESSKKGGSMGGGQAAEGQLHRAVSQDLSGTYPQHLGAVQPRFLACQM